jgi:ABC-type branched-subunit amino acid transport system ATPase component
LVLKLLVVDRAARKSREAFLEIKTKVKISILLVELYLDFCLHVGESFYTMDRGEI